MRPRGCGESAPGDPAACGRAFRIPACADVPAFPLQLLLRRRPEWQGLPVVVVDADEPQGRVLWANEEARRERVLPGQRYASALALARGLRADVVPEEEIRRGILEIAARLRRFTPSVEPSRDEPGVFRVDAGGLARLHPDLAAWAEEVRADLASAGLRASVVVGTSEFGAYAVARALAARLLPTDARPAAAQPQPPPPGKTAPTVLVLDAAAEARVLRRVPLDRLAIDPDARDLLAKLGVRTVADFLALPAEGLRERFGEDAHRLHRLASGEVRDPLLPEDAPEPLRASVILDHPEKDGARLLFLLKRLVDLLLLRTAERREAVAGLDLLLGLEDDTSRREVLRPAAATLDGAQLLDLLRLRIEGTSSALPRGTPPPKRSPRAPPGVAEVVLTFATVPATNEQLALFAEKPRRDLAAAARAFARLRAEFGEDAVVRARLRDAHLPEASFTWERLERIELPRARASARAVLVRRLLTRPVPLPPRPRHEPDGWMLRGLEHGSVVRIEGPYLVSGGWWGGSETRREYHFAETTKGRVFWVYYDVTERRWQLQADVS